MLSSASSFPSSGKPSLDQFIFFPVISAVLWRKYEIQTVQEQGIVANMKSGENVTCGGNSTKVYSKVLSETHSAICTAVLAAIR
jgi:hypothetical protein